MRILMTSYSYAPAVGGLETVSRLVADGLRERGHDLALITQTPASDSSGWIARRPSLWRALRLTWQADVVLQSNISLRWLWMALLLRRPVLLVCHTWLSRPDGRIGWQDRLKRILSRRVKRCLAVSQVLATHIGPHCQVLLNPVDLQRFAAVRARRAAQPAPCTADAPLRIVFLGRLVSDKGCDLAIRSLAQLRANGFDARLDVVGDGPELTPPRSLAAGLDVQAHCTFHGTLQGNPLSDVLAQNRILLAPSRWQEPFGLVAVEALACGLVPVVPNAGSFPEAAGGLGAYITALEPGTIASAVLIACQQAPDEQVLSVHLQRFAPATVLNRYVQSLEDARA